jgi:anti-sigma regulatory factor (Ser/Thr protein kinase)
VDWYLAGDDPADVTALRHRIRDHLVRHATPGTDVSDAELVVQELLANAFEHADGPAWVQLTWADDRPHLVVRDLGAGFTLPASAAPGAPRPGLGDEALWSEGGRGLWLVSHLSGELAVAARRGGGTEVRTVLPVQREASRSIDPAPLPIDVLPGLDEARPEGGFGRETFLRALVVQLSQAVEHTAGPDVGEEVIAHVGIAVGGQMEAEYRLAQEIVGRLSPAQIADCLVRLKHAIDGDFSVVEVTDERIVLSNTRCPFGDAVRRAPALCRMTSSVFGGIAARNGDGEAAVVLEERIAVGDPGCRVVVYLGSRADDARSFLHRYRGLAATAP